MEQSSKVPMAKSSRRALNNFSVGVSSSSDASAMKKEDILFELFGDVGDLIEDYSCAVESGGVLLHGRMYLTHKFLCFYSSIFGLEKKIRIPFLNIKSITKENTALLIPNAICVTTYRKDYTKEYIFRSFWDRDECHGILIRILDSVTKSPHEEISPSTQVSQMSLPTGAIDAEIPSISAPFSQSIGIPIKLSEDRSEPMSPSSPVQEDDLMFDESAAENSVWKSTYRGDSGEEEIDSGECFHRIQTRTLQFRSVQL